MSSRDRRQDPDAEEEGDSMLEAEEIGEEIPEDEDAPMESDEEGGGGGGEQEGLMDEIQLQNDSVAHFDAHTDSIFCIAHHPVQTHVVATGGGDDLGYVWDSTPPEKPVLPLSYQSDPTPRERAGIKPTTKLKGHTDSISAITFTLPHGEYLLTAGLDGRLIAYHNTNHPSSSSSPAPSYTHLATTQEVQEINFLLPCPHSDYPNTVALGAGDGSVWVYTVDASSPTPLCILQAFYLHTGPVTAGAWTTDGRMLATVSEDSSFYLWDVFGEAAAQGLVPAGSGNNVVVGLTGADERFHVEGGLYSIAISPGDAIAAVGGAEGAIRIIGLPRLSAAANAGTPGGRKSSGAGGKAGGRKQAGGPKGASSGGTGSGQAGQILANLQAQSDSIETLSFSSPPSTLLAAGSVDGSICLFDAAHRFAVRRHIRGAHEDEAVIKLDWSRADATHGSRTPGAPTPTHASPGWLLTSVGNDGVCRRWGSRGGTAAHEAGLVKEWRGHRGGGEGGGILAFVQVGGGTRIVTAGDDGVALVFEA